ncbi:MAG: hypothetical protein ACR2M5_09450, partial [Nakamurella sp.]
IFASQPPANIKTTVEVSGLMSCWTLRRSSAPFLPFLSPDPWSAVDTDGGVAGADVPLVPLRLTARCGTAAVIGLNDALVIEVIEAKALRTNNFDSDDRGLGQ